MAAPGEPTRTLYYQQGTRWCKLTIPATAKVTFGPLIPGRGDVRPMSQQGMYLRVYKTKDHQLAVIPNVVQFRDAETVFEAATTRGFERVDEETLLGEMVERELRGDSKRRCIYCDSGEVSLAGKNIHGKEKYQCDNCDQVFSAPSTGGI